MVFLCQKAAIGPFWRFVKNGPDRVEKDFGHLPAAKTANGFSSTEYAGIFLVDWVRVENDP